MTSTSPESGIPPRFQFSIAALLWVTLILAILLTILFRLPFVAAYPLVFFVSIGVLPAAWTTLIIYGRGYQRTLAIGAMFPSGFCQLFALMAMFEHAIPIHSWNPPGDEDLLFRFVFAGFWASSIVVGLICMGLRRLVEKCPPSQNP